jgi:hypothetical protein
MQQPRGNNFKKKKFTSKELKMFFGFDRLDLARKNEK